jgi:hypothetical protein
MAALTKPKTEAATPVKTVMTAKPVITVTRSIPTEAAICHATN